MLSLPHIKNCFLYLQLLRKREMRATSGKAKVNDDTINYRKVSIIRGKVF